MSTPSSTPTPLVVVGALAAALLVVGAAAAIGIGSSSSGRRAGSSVSAGSPSVGISPGGPASTLASPGGSRATTTTTVPAAAPAGGGGSRSTGGTGGSSPVPVAPHTTTTMAGSSSSASQSSGLGTYTYATSGQSKIFGKTSSYPSTTTIDVTKSGCGESSQWDSSPGNSTTIVACPVAGGIHVVSETDTTDAGGYHMTQTFECTPNSFVPLSGQPGSKYRWSCSTSNGETADEVVTLDGPATLTVDGTAVQSEHVSIVSNLSGQESGTADTEDWLTTGALRIKETGSINASAYGISYTSNYTIDLDSLKPS